MSSTGSSSSSSSVAGGAQYYRQRDTRYDVPGFGHAGARTAVLRLSSEIMEYGEESLYRQEVAAMSQSAFQRDIEAPDLSVLAERLGEGNWMHQFDGADAPGIEVGGVEIYVFAATVVWTRVTDREQPADAAAADGATMPYTQMGPEAELWELAAAAQEDPGVFWVTGLAFVSAKTTVREENAPPVDRVHTGAAGIALHIVSLMSVVDAGSASAEAAHLAYVREVLAPELLAAEAELRGPFVGDRDSAQLWDAGTHTVVLPITVPRKPDSANMPVADLVLYRGLSSGSRAQWYRYVGGYAGAEGQCFVHSSLVVEGYRVYITQDMDSDDFVDFGDGGGLVTAYDADGWNAELPKAGEAANTEATATAAMCSLHADSLQDADAPPQHLPASDRYLMLAQYSWFPKPLALENLWRLIALSAITASELPNSAAIAADGTDLWARRLRPAPDVARTSAVQQALVARCGRPLLTVAHAASRNNRDETVPMTLREVAESEALVLAAYASLSGVMREYLPLLAAEDGREAYRALARTWPGAPVEEGARDAGIAVPAVAVVLPLRVTDSQLQAANYTKGTAGDAAKDNTETRLVRMEFVDVLRAEFEKSLPDALAAVGLQTNVTDGTHSYARVWTHIYAHKRWVPFKLATVQLLLIAAFVRTLWPWTVPRQSRRDHAMRDMPLRSMTWSLLNRAIDMGVIAPGAHTVGKLVEWRVHEAALRAVLPEDLVAKLVKSPVASKRDVANREAIRSGTVAITQAHVATRRRRTQTWDVRVNNVDVDTATVAVADTGATTVTSNMSNVDESAVVAHRVRKRSRATALADFLAPEQTAWLFSRSTFSETARSAVTDDVLQDAIDAARVGDSGGTSLLPAALAAPLIDADTLPLHQSLVQALGDERPDSEGRRSWLRYVAATHDFSAPEAPAAASEIDPEDLRADAVNAVRVTNEDLLVHSLPSSVPPTRELLRTAFTLADSDPTPPMRWRASGVEQDITVYLLQVEPSAFVLGPGTTTAAVREFTLKQRRALDGNTADVSYFGSDFLRALNLAGSNVGRVALIHNATGPYVVVFADIDEAIKIMALFDPYPPAVRQQQTESERLRPLQAALPPGSPVSALVALRVPAGQKILGVGRSLATGSKSVVVLEAPLLVRVTSSHIVTTRTGAQGSRALRERYMLVRAEVVV